MTVRALEVRERYAAFEERTYGRQWSLEDLTLGLVGDVGDLVKLVQAHEGVRAVENARPALEHELADVLWSLLVIAKRCDVDLETAFAQDDGRARRRARALGRRGLLGRARARRPARGLAVTKSAQRRHTRVTTSSLRSRHGGGAERSRAARADRVHATGERGPGRAPRGAPRPSPGGGGMGARGGR